MYLQKKEKSKREEKNNTSENDTGNNEDTVNETSFAQDVICFVCGKPGHKATECTKRNTIPRGQWYINKAFSALQGTNKGENEEEEKNNASESSSNNNKKTNNSSKNGKVTWSGFQCFLDQNEAKKTYKLKDMIILDNGSTMDGTFMNPDLVKNIKQAESPIMMQTNAGTRGIDKVAEVNGFGEVYFDEGQMANKFGFATMVDKADRVTFDSNIEDAFIIYKDGKTTKFKRTPERLYGYVPGNEYKNEMIQNNEVKNTSLIVCTQKENKTQ